jgi:hypothetical protein
VNGNIGRPKGNPKLQTPNKQYILHMKIRPKYPTSHHDHILRIEIRPEHSNVKRPFNQRNIINGNNTNHQMT